MADTLCAIPTTKNPMSFDTGFDIDRVGGLLLLQTEVDREGKV